jgi:hypothetical protein
LAKLKPHLFTGPFAAKFPPAVVENYYREWVKTNHPDFEKEEEPPMVLSPDVATRFPRTVSTLSRKRAADPTVCLELTNQ